MKAPPRVLVSTWLALHGRILTVDNLCRRNRILVNACPMCLVDEETVGHLLLGSQVAGVLWNSVLSLFGCNGVLPQCIFGHFEAWSLSTCSGIGGVIWEDFFPTSLVDNLEREEIPLL